MKQLEHALELKIIQDFYQVENLVRPPPTLFEYLPDNAIIFCDESHVTVLSLNGMYKGDHTRKKTLSDYGFRLPSCMDNRPLKFEEWDMMRPQTIFVSATPGDWELDQSKGCICRTNYQTHRIN